MDRWLLRIAIAALVAVILLVAAALGLVSRPALVFYLAAAVVGLIALLIWFESRNANPKRGREDEQADADETTLPSYHDSISPGPPPSSGTH